MWGQIYVSETSARPGRLILGAIAFFLLATLLAGLMVQSRQGSLPLRRLGMDELGISFDAPSGMMVESPASGQDKVIRLRGLSTRGIDFIILLHRIPDDGFDSLENAVLTWWSVNDDQPPSAIETTATRAAPPIAGQDAIEVGTPPDGLVVRGTQLNDDAFLIMAVYTANRPLDAETMDHFNQVCDSVTMPSP